MGNLDVILGLFWRTLHNSGHGGDSIACNAVIFNVLFALSCGFSDLRKAVIGSA